MKSVGSHRLFNLYLSLIACLGLFAVFYSLYCFPLKQLNFSFVLISIMTLGIGARLNIQVPRVKGYISLSDIFIFLTILLYGAEAAVLLASLEAFCLSLRVNKKPTTIIFNTAGMSVSTFITVMVMRLCFGNIIELTAGKYNLTYFSAITLMCFVQYTLNTGMVAIGSGLKTNQPIINSWRDSFRWTFLTYFAGASAAALIAKLINVLGFYAFIGTTPFIGIIYFTYLTYMKNVEASASQIEQAKRHVQELSHYIAEQERIREQFTQLEKMSALGELASGVAHDFNNTLAGILGRAQLLLRTNDPEKIKRGLQIIIKTAGDGAQTVKRIQDFARQRRAHDFAPVAVDQLLYDVSEMTRPRWKDRAEAENISIHLYLQVNSQAIVSGDESELREVLVNMVFNAVDAMPQGGNLTLSTNEADGFVLISIQDTGCGMTPEVRSRIFDPFFTTKGKAGLGLGLAVSYGIIHRHEGIVEVESELGRGTIFRLKLPISKNAATIKPVVEQARESHISKDPDAPQNKILVVDDEVHVRELLAEILQSEGCEVAMASSGNDALELLEANRFDAIFTDIGMPGMSGWELARIIRERNTTIPLAVITGWGEAVGSLEQQAAQIDWVVTKPFAMARIVELAHNVSQRRASL